MNSGIKHDNIYFGRCLSIPYPVTSLALVSEAGGPSCAGYLHPSLRYLHGVLAVGMTEVWTSFSCFVGRIEVDLKIMLAF